MTHDQCLICWNILEWAIIPKDKVKVWFLCCYLLSEWQDGILNKDYYDLLLGQDLAFIRLIMNLGDIRLWRVWLSIDRLPLLLILAARFRSLGMKKRFWKTEWYWFMGREVSFSNRSDYNYSEGGRWYQRYSLILRKNTENEVEEGNPQTCRRNRREGRCGNTLLNIIIIWEAYDIALLRNAMNVSWIKLFIKTSKW